MKYLKYFESIKVEPKIGDYVYLHLKLEDTNLSSYEIEESKKRIFSITKILHQGDDIVYKVDVVPEKGKPEHEPWYVFNDTVICFAPAIEELKIKISVDKYNL